MLTPCVNCGFYLKQTDEFCLNCGIVNPNENLIKKRPRTNRLQKLLRSNLFLILSSLFLSFLFVFIVADGSVENFPHLKGYIWLIALILWMSLFLSTFVLFKTRIFQKKLPHVIKYKNNLNSKTKIIDRRMAELSSRAQRIDAVLDKIRETDGESLQEVRRKLLAAREIVMNHYARYELQRQKIGLLRVQNGISPYLFGLHRLSGLETDLGLRELESTHAAIDQMRQGLTRYDAIDFPENAMREKQAFLAQLDETGESCQKLREALLSRQAARALQDISPIEESFKLPPAKDAAREAEIFNIQTTLTDFSESFDELEREYKRLKAEEDAERKLLAE